MATSSATLQLVIKLKDQASKGMKTISKSMDSITDSVFNLKNAFLGLGLAAAIKEVTGVFTEFDDTIRGVGAVAGATSSELEDLTATAKKMGAETAFSAVQAADGLNYLSRAGFSVKESIEALPKTLQLAAAGAVDLGVAADITTNVMAAYGLGTEELGRTNDVLTKAFTSTNATLEELGTAFSYVGPIAHGVGGEFENLVGTLGALHSAGIKGSMAGTTLRGTLDALFNPTKEEAELMAQLSDRIGGAGLVITDAAGDFVGFTEIVKQLEMANFSAAESLKLFGQRAGPGMQALLGQGSAALEELDEKLRQSGGTAEKIAKQMEAGIGGATRSMISAFEGLKIELAEGFEGVAIDAIRYFRAEILLVTATINKLKESGKIEEWATNFIDAMKTGWEYTKLFASGVMKLEPLIQIFVAWAPEILALASAWYVLGKAQDAAKFTGIAALSKVGFKAVTTQLILYGKQFLAFIPKVGGAAKALQLFAVQALAVGAAAFAGWEVGKWINTLTLFGDKTKTVGSQVQAFYEIMFGPQPGAKRLAKELDNLKAKFEEFKDFKLPENVTGSTTAEIREMSTALQKARGYWELVKQEQELALQSAIELYGTESVMADKWRAALEGTKKKLTEVREEIQKLAGVDQVFEEQIKAAKKSQGELVQLVKDLGGVQVAEIKKNQQAELDALEKQVQKKTVTLIEAEKKRVEIIEKWAPKIQAKRLETAEKVARAELETQTETLALLRDQALAIAERDIESQAQLAIKKYQIENDYQLKITELRAATEKKLETIASGVLKKSKEDVEKLVKIQEAGENSILANKAAALADVDRLEAESLVNSRAIAELNVAFHLTASEKRLGIDEEAEKVRTQIQTDAAQNRLSIEESFLAEQLSQARDFADDMAESTAAGSEERAKAIQKIQELEGELVAFQAKKAQELADIQIEAAESARDRKQAAIQAETDFRSAEYEKQIAAIELEEARGYISMQTATEQKMEAERLFTEFRIQSLAAVADRAAAEYGRESAEFQAAVAQKMQAQAQLENLKESMEDVTEATDDMAESTKEAASSSSLFFEATGAGIDRIVDAAQKMGTTALFSIDETKNSLSDLTKIMEENYQTVVKFYNTTAQVYAVVAESQNKEIRLLIEAFDDIARTANEAGLAVDLMGMTLAEAAADVATRTESYREFKNEVVRLKHEFSTMSISVEGVDEIDAARESFQEAATWAGFLGEEIKRMNTAFGSGDLELAEQMADDVVGSYEQIYERAKEYLELLKGEWQTYADKVIEVQNQILELNLSFDEKVRNSRRKTWSEEEVWQDKRLEYEEVYAEATRLANEGQAEASVKMFEKAIALAEKLQGVVRDESGETVSTLEENTTLSINLMEMARTSAESALRDYQSTLQDSQNAIQRGITENTSWMWQFGNSISSAVTEAEKLKQTIGGMGGGPTFGFAGGGGIPRRRAPGRMPGTDTGKDEMNVKVRLGEWLIANEATGFWQKNWGADFMHGINRPFSGTGQRIQAALAAPGFAEGGPVGGGTNNVNVAFPEMQNMGSFTLQGPAGAVRGFGPTDAVNAVIAEAEKSSWLRTQ